MDALRPYLLPLTRSLPYPLPSLGTTLLGPTCYTTLIHDLDLTHTPCLRLALSKTLGLGIVLTSSVVKIPQLLKLRASRSSAGISPLACALETAAYLITLAYSARSGFPFTTYGETALIAVQNVVVTVLVLRYQGRQAAAGMFVAGVVLGGGCLWEGRVVGEGVLRGLQAGAGVLAAASKAPQIWEVWRNGGTGQLSAFAVFMFCAGSLTRIFTTLQEVDDRMILYQYLVGFVLNAVLAAQMVYYWRSPATASHAQEMGKEAEKMAMGSASGSAPKAKGPSTRRRG